MDNFIWSGCLPNVFTCFVPACSFSTSLACTTSPQEWRGPFPRSVSDQRALQVTAIFFGLEHSLKRALWLISMLVFLMICDETHPSVQ